MTPEGTLPAEFLTHLAQRLLQAIDDTPLAAMDATFYAHYFEELRLIVETLLDDIQPPAAPGRQVWIVWDCQEPIACYLTQQEAVAARADLQHELRSTHGPHLELPDTLTISSATLEPDRCTQTGPCS